jgi:hypothetical protein
MNYGLLWRCICYACSVTFGGGLLIGSASVLVKLFSDWYVSLIIMIAGFAGACKIIYNKYGRTLNTRSKITTLGMGCMIGSALTDAIIERQWFSIVLYLSMIFLMFIIVVARVYRVSNTLTYEPRRDIDVSQDYSPLREVVIHTYHSTDDSVHSCIICLEDLEDNVVSINNCGHKFHDSCINEWLIRKRECPLCRAITG